jgi:GT2 family glycosyltransferase
MKIGVVILNYNSFQDTIELVRKLQFQTVASKLEIVIIDNSSPNRSFEKLIPLKREFDNVTVLQTGENLGYAKGNNFGLNFLDENVKPEYVVILNNDIIIPIDCIEKLVEKYKVLERPGIIAPTEKSVDGKISLFGNMLSFREDLLSLSILYRHFYKRRMKLIDNTKEGTIKVEMIAGGLMFSSFKVFREIGFFYPNTFLYVEERFVAYALKKRGYNNYVLREEEYIHNHSKTIDSFHNVLGKYKMVHKGILEYTTECREMGEIKAAILKPFMFISLIEIRIFYWLKNLFITNDK